MTGEDMGYFVIGKLNFGIDAEKSSFSVTPQGDGVYLIDLEILADEDSYKRLEKEHDREGMFGWCFSPSFYVHCFRPRVFPVLTADGKTMLQAKVSAKDQQECEIAVYWGEHNLVSNVSIQVIDEVEILVAGTVDLMGELDTFRVHWLRRR
jgi:hypothetical protein